MFMCVCVNVCLGHMSALKESSQEAGVCLVSSPVAATVVAWVDMSATGHRTTRGLGQGLGAEYGHES